MIRVPVRVQHLRNVQLIRRSCLQHRIGDRGIDRRRFTAVGVADQPYVIVIEDGDSADGQAAHHHWPVFGIDAQGSAGARDPPFCSSSIEMLSGERTKAMCPSRGGRLIVTPASISRWHAS
jgi:hypothetical protein